MGGLRAMRSRDAGPATSSELAARQTFVQAWVRTTGGASQSLDVGYQVTSITDAALGLLDVTWTQPFTGATTYAVIAAIQSSDLVVEHVQIDNATPPTSSAVRIECITSSTQNAVDPASGYFVLACGV